MDSIDKLLAQIKAEYREDKGLDEPQKQQIPSQPIARSLPQQPSLDSLLNGLEAGEPVKQQHFSNPPKSETSLNSVLSDLKVDFEAQDRAEEIRRQEQLKTEELKKQKIKQQELEALERQAIAWLKKLDPLSTEGIWFEKFAEKYSSKLAAAIVYLQDLQANQ